MKSQTITALFAIVLMTAVSSCKDKAKEAETSAAEEVAEATVVSEKYMATPSSSTIEWKGFKPTGSHNGTIALSSGEFTMSNGTIESGTFMIDMGSLVVLDIPAEDEGNGKLAGHLKGADFFDVEQYPNATFEVTGMNETDGATMLSGNLTLKGVENNITIPVTVSETDNTVTLTSDVFTIDRSKWNVKYGSKSFFDDLGDRFINDDIELKINVMAKKA